MAFGGFQSSYDFFPSKTPFLGNWNVLGSLDNGLQRVNQAGNQLAYDPNTGTARSMDLYNQFGLGDIPQGTTRNSIFNAWLTPDATSAWGQISQMQGMNAPNDLTKRNQLIQDFESRYGLTIPQQYRPQTQTTPQLTVSGWQTAPRPTTALQSPMVAQTTPAAPAQMQPRIPQPQTQVPSYLQQYFGQRQPTTPSPYMNQPQFAANRFNKPLLNQPQSVGQNPVYEQLFRQLLQYYLGR